METTVLRAAISHFTTEYVKMRRHSVFTVAMLAPLPVLAVGILDLTHVQSAANQEGSVLWKTVYMAVWMPWIAVLLPVLVSFYITAAVNIEHSGNHWKQLLTYPAPLWGLYASKMIYCAGLAGLSTAIYCVGWAVILAVLSKGAVGVSPYAIVLAAAKAWLASWLIIPLQAWLSVRLPGAGRPLLIAMVALAAGIVLFDPRSRAGYSYPWTQCLSTGEFFGPRHDALLPAVAGGIGSIASGCVISWRLARTGRRGLVHAGNF